MKKFARLTSLLLAMVMLFGLIACQSANAPAKTDAPAKTNAPAKADAPADKPADEPADDEPYGPRAYEDTVSITIPVYDRGASYDVTNNWWTAWIQSQMLELYNIDVAFEAIPRTDEVNRFTQLIAVKEAPDIIGHYEIPFALNYQSMGALQPIDETMMEEYMPDYIAFASQGQTLNFGYAGTDRYFIPAVRLYNAGASAGGYVRTDWMDAVGIEKLPENLKEFNEMLIAFRDAKLGGDHTVPYARTFPNAVNITNEGSVFFMGDFTEYEKALYLDINMPPFTWGPAREWMQWLNYCYNEKLISAEFPLEAATDVPRAYFLTGEAGASNLMSISAQGTAATYWPTLVENCPEAQISAYSHQALCPEGITYQTFQSGAYGFLSGINVYTEHPEAVMMYINWLCQDETLDYMQFGDEGKQYNIVDGYKVRDAAYAGEDALLGGTNGDMWIYATVGTIQTDDQVLYNLLDTTHEDLLWIVEEQTWDWGKTVLANAWQPYAWGKAIESQTEYVTILTDKYAQLLTEVVTCSIEKFDAVYEDACQQFLDAGYAEILAEKEAVFFEMNPGYSGETDIHDVIK